MRLCGTELEGTSSTGPWFVFSQLVGELDVEWDLELFSQVPDNFPFINNMIRF